MLLGETSRSFRTNDSLTVRRTELLSKKFCINTLPFTILLLTWSLVFPFFIGFVFTSIFEKQPSFGGGLIIAFVFFASSLQLLICNIYKISVLHSKILTDKEFTEINKNLLKSDLILNIVTIVILHLVFGSLFEHSRFDFKVAVTLYLISFAALGMVLYSNNRFINLMINNRLFCNTPNSEG